MALLQWEFSPHSPWPDRLAVGEYFLSSLGIGATHRRRRFGRLEVTLSIRGRNYDLILRDRGVGEIAARKLRPEGRGR